MYIYFIYRKTFWNHFFDNRLTKNFIFTIINEFFFTNYKFIILSLMCLIIYKNKIMLFLFKNVKI